MYHVVRTRIHCSQCRLQSIISIYACFFERFMATHTRPKRQRFAGSYNERQPQAAPSGLDYSQTSLSATIGTAKCITTDEAEAVLSKNRVAHSRAAPGRKRKRPPLRNNLDRKIKSKRPKGCCKTCRRRRIRILRPCSL